MFPSLKKSKTDTQIEAKQEQIEVMEQLASRICHDLISPVGAIHNGLEFLEEMGADALDDALGLMTHSTKQATTKLKAFRLAYGAGGRDPMMSVKNVHEALHDFVALEDKIKMNWGPQDITFEDEYPPAFCKVLAGALLLLCEMMPKGGEITLSHKGNAVTLTAAGENVSCRDGLVEALQGEVDSADIDPRGVTAYLLGTSLSAFGYDVAMAQSDDEVAMTLSF